MKFHHRWAAAALFAVASGVSTLSHAAAVSGQGTWETTLQGRDLDGNLATFEAWYDTALNITWLTNINAGAGSSYDDGVSTNDGLMTWASADAWATSLNFNGISGWRLPIMTDLDAVGCNFGYIGTDCGYNVDTATSEMAYMYYVTLGNKASYDSAGNYPQPGWGPTNTGPFSNIVFDSPDYWLATEYAPNTSFAWIFAVQYDGLQEDSAKTDERFAWAVHSGDVGAAAVPVPATAWLFGSGLLGLIGFAQRRSRAHRERVFSVP